MKTAADNFQHAILEAIEGHVTKQLITPRDIRRVVHKLTNTDNLLPLFANNFMMLYPCLTSYVTSQGLSILVPLNPPSKQKAYIIHPFPTKLNETYMIIQSMGTILTTHAKHIVTQSNALALPQGSLSNICLTPKREVFVCLKPIWKYTTNTSSCEHAIISYNHNIQTTCEFKEIHPTNFPYTVNTALQTLFYFFEPMTASISCTGTTTQRTLNGSYILPHHCSMKCETFLYPAIKHLTTSFTKKLQYPTPTKLPNPTFNLLPHLNVTLEKIPKQNDVPKLYHHEIFAYGYPVAMSVSTVVVIFLILMAISCCIKKYNN